MGGSSISSIKPLMLFTGRDSEYSVEYYLNAVTVNLIKNIGHESASAPFHQNWTYRRTVLNQMTLDFAAQKWFSFLPIEIKSDWKRFTQEFSKLLTLKKQATPKSLMHEIPRIPNKTIKHCSKI